MNTAVQSPNSQLTVWRSNDQSLPLSIVDCCLEWNPDTNPTDSAQDSQKTLTKLTIQCTIAEAAYQHVMGESWFNLSTDAQKAETLPSFNEDSPIFLELNLSPDLLEQWNSTIATPEDAIAHLHALSQQTSNGPSDGPSFKTLAQSPLLQETNWYCTTIQQEQETGTVSHYTLWHYLLPTLTNPNSDAIAQGITHYIQDQTTASLNQITQATDPLFQDIAQTFQDLFTGALSELDSETEESSGTSGESSNVLAAIVADFLESEEWPYAQLSNSSSDNDLPLTTLRLAFRGDNGQWSCYVKINQEQQTVCFYSICPVSAEADQCDAIAHFITRANYGMVLGNFELDFSDGEIRYKTSIDVEGDRLTPALVQNLVYTNVMMMDQYLPGVIAVLDQGLSPEEAIALVENQ